MADDIASLVIKVQSLEAQLAEKRLNKLERQGGKTERATDGLTSAFKRMAGPLAGIISVSAGLNKLFETTQKFQNLRVQLETATGSAEGAARALDLIRQFAEDTGQPVDEVAQAFVKLKNLGLDPSEKALVSYGNTAAAMGKNLDQLIEAVADATTGEFERLKEFGIKSSVEGDRVKFTFQGMTTEVEKSASAIEGYLQGLGENEFAGALEKKADTLSGSVNQLQNSWDELFQVVSEQGTDELMADAFNIANDALQKFTQSIASGQLQGHIAAVGGKFDGFAQDVTNGFAILEELFRNEFQFFEDTGSNAADFIGDAFLDMPENIRAAIQIAATELAYFVDRVGIWADDIAHDLNPKNWFGDDAEFEAQIQARVAAANQARQDSIVAIMDERQAKLDNYETEIDAVNRAAEAHARLREAKGEDSGSLGDFAQKKGQGGEGGDNPEDQEGGTFTEQLETLKYQLELEEVTLEESYSRRQNLLASLLESNQINQTKYNKESLKNLVQFNKGKERAEQDSAQKRAAIEKGFVDSSLTIATAAFGKSKKFSQAIGAVKTIESVISSYARGAEIGGPYLGAAYAAAAFAAQYASQQKMDSVSIGGGGSIGGASPSPSLPPVSIADITSNQTGVGQSSSSREEEDKKPTLNFVFNGPVNQAEGIIDMITEKLNEQDYILFDSASRQAQTLREA